MKVEGARESQMFDPILLKLTIESEEEKTAFVSALKIAWYKSDKTNKMMFDEIIKAIESYS